MRQIIPSDTIEVGTRVIVGELDSIHYYGKIINIDKEKKTFSVEFPETMMIMFYYGVDKSGFIYNSLIRESKKYATVGKEVTADMYQIIKKYGFWDIINGLSNAMQIKIDTILDEKDIIRKFYIKRKVMVDNLKVESETMNEQIN